jgi:MraZ protein
MGRMNGVQPFIGKISAKLDSKGRVCIPAHYRQTLAALGTPGVYVCPSFHEGALECFGEDVLQKFYRTQAELDPFFAREHDDKARSVLTQTELLSPDENGRVRLPDEMIAHAGLEEGDTIVFVGLGTKFQIWDRERFAPILAKTLDSARALRESSGNGSGA